MSILQSTSIVSSQNTTVDTLIDNVAKRLKNHASNPNRQIVCISEEKLQSEDLEKIETKLLQFGLRLRLSWDAAEHTLWCKMASGIHESLSPWWADSQAIFKAPLKKTQFHADCFSIGPQVHGSPTIKLAPIVQHQVVPPTTRKFSVQAPDQSLTLCLSRGGKSRLYHDGYPVMVCEVAYSQRLANVLANTWKYLYCSEAKIQMVLVYDLSYPVTQIEDFKARIAVWTRSENARAKFNCHSLDDEAHSDSGNSQGSSWDDNKTMVDPEDQESNAETSWRRGSYTLAGQDDEMVCHIASITVIDESVTQSSLPPLRLNISDLIPCCSNHPMHWPDQVFELDLNDLRDYTMLRVESQRSILLKNERAKEQAEKTKEQEDAEESCDDEVEVRPPSPQDPKPKRRRPEADQDRAKKD